MGTSPIGHFSNSAGSIYPALQQLKKHGLIEGRVGSTVPN
jgi:DNA-binding PadR family transcriptional regulator